MRLSWFNMRVFKRWILRATLAFFTLGALPVAVAADKPAGPLPTEALTTLLVRVFDAKSGIKNRRYAAVLNYRQPSWEPRFHLIDIEKAEHVESYVVAHGRGSDPDHDGYATEFSDEPESHMSSLGFFVTDEIYMSESDGHGLSMRLNGLSDDNRNAQARDIVIHGNWYVEPEVLTAQRKPGRSYGCMVFSAADRDAVVEKLKDGALIYAVY